MKLTLTFDNGPDPEVTPRVLDLLARHGMRAWFFVLGKHLEEEAGRALVKRALAEGHLVGNHSYSHEIPLGDDPRADAVEKEIATTQRQLEALVPGERIFRPFGGGGVLGPHLLSRSARDHLCAERFDCVLWNSVPGDWIEGHDWVASAKRDLETQSHALMVLHDISGACIEELGGFLDHVARSEVEVVLDFPTEQVPIRGGEVVADLEPLVRA